MGKQHVKPVKRPKRTVEVSDGVRAVMAGLTPAERSTIEAACQSVTAVRRLPVEYVVNATSGDMYVARVTPRLRLIYRLTPGGIEVADLLSAGAVAFLLHPTVRSNKPKHRPTTFRRPKGHPVPRAPETGAELTTNT